MTDPQNAELIVRLEKATGPDRRLDAMIYGQVHWPQGGWEVVDLHDGRHGPEGHSIGPVVMRVTVGDHRSFVGTLPYTGSIDAALSLLPKDPIYSDWAIERDDDLYRASTHAPHGQRNYSQGATPAIALCIAALRARAVHS